MSTADDIIQATETYLSTENASYAIMIDGDWGTGKTFLWQQELSKLENIHPLYISLFGLKSIQDIENEMFRALSIFGKNGRKDLIKDSLNSLSMSIEGVKVGALGYIAYFALTKWKESLLKKNQNIFICFDDLERWEGELNVCISYINKLVEHDKTKCIILGNSQKISVENEHRFTESLTKSIRFKYSLEHTKEELIAIAISVADYPNDATKASINDIFSIYQPHIVELLNISKCSNIRTLSTSINYLACIYSNNSQVFNSCPSFVIAYYLSLLATLILTTHYCKDEDERLKVLVKHADNCEELKSDLGVSHFSKEKDIEFNDYQKILAAVIDSAYYQGNIEKRSGILSIIKNGFYKTSDFAGEFDNWESESSFDFYIDNFRYRERCRLSDADAKKVFDEAYDIVFHKKIITDPFYYTRFANIVIFEIKKGFLDLNERKFTEDLLRIVKGAYDTRRMKVLKNLDDEVGHPSFEFCRDFYSAICKLNKTYVEERDREELSNFWSDIGNRTDDLSSFVRRYYSQEIFSSAECSVILEALEDLSNEHLFEFEMLLRERLKSEHITNVIETEHQNAKNVGFTIREKYQDMYGNKAGHMKDIARMLINKSYKLD